MNDSCLHEECKYVVIMPVRIMGSPDVVGTGKESVKMTYITYSLERTWRISILVIDFVGTSEHEYDRMVE